MFYNRLYNLLCLAVLLCCACASDEPREAVNPISPPAKTMALAEVNRQLMEKDKDIIESKMRRKGWEMEYHPEGYYSMLISEGTGKKISDASTVELICKVQLLNGTLCYDNQIRSFNLSKTNEIAGLQQGVFNQREGDKLRFIFPPQLAYGLLGDQDKIPPRAALIVEVEILNVE